MKKLFFIKALLFVGIFFVVGGFSGAGEAKAEDLYTCLCIDSNLETSCITGSVEVGDTLCLGFCAEHDLSYVDIFGGINQKANCESYKAEQAYEHKYCLCSNKCSRAQVNISGGRINYKCPDDCDECTDCGLNETENDCLSNIKTVVPVVPPRTVYTAYFENNDGGFLPDCVLSNNPAVIFSKECRNITVFIALGINIARFLFSIVGAIALLAFVYGGFMLIISGGNQEKTKKGFNALMSAIIGMAVTFSGYILVRFLAEAVGLVSEFSIF